jgi:transposase
VLDLPARQDAPGSHAPNTGRSRFRLPCAEPLSRFTTRFESWAVDQLSECSVTGAGRLLRTSWDETWGLMARAVARGQAVKEPSAPRHVGVDEKSVGHGTTSPSSQTLTLHGRAHRR